jgi:hypothetical protein
MGLTQFAGAGHGQDIWHDMRHTAAWQLVRAQIAQPFGEEAGGVHIEASGTDKDLGVAGPTQALVTLRAVGGHVDKVAFLTPNDIVLQLVDERARAFKGTGWRRVRMKHDAREVLGHRLTGKTLDTYGNPKNVKWGSNSSPASDEPLKV